jgi:hypothetical protein
MVMETTKLLEEYVIEACVSCGVSFAVTKEHNDILRRKGRTFYCPNGHGMNYPGEEERNEKQILKQQIKSLENHRNNLYNRLHESEREHRTLKRKIADLKKQLQSGNKKDEKDSKKGSKKINNNPLVRAYKKTRKTPSKLGGHMIPDLLKWIVEKNIHEFDLEDFFKAYPKQRFQPGRQQSYLSRLITQNKLVQVGNTRFRVVA